MENKMKLTKEEGQDLVDGCLEGWQKIQKSLSDTTRWSICYEGIFLHIETKKHYKIEWSVGATECQDEQPFSYSEPELVEVHQVEKLVKVWESK